MPERYAAIGSYINSLCQIHTVEIHETTIFRIHLLILLSHNESYAHCLECF